MWTNISKLLEYDVQSNIVKNWFGEQFNNLDPQLQKLHVLGGELSGDITITYGTGLAGLIGQRLAKKMQLPPQGIHALTVAISHSEQGLHWDRQFNNNTWVKSLFTPIGDHKSGFWLETTGPLKMKLTVDIKAGGWYWRSLGVSLFSIPIPLWLTPKANAFKNIHNDKYQFKVQLSLPFLGELVCYDGLLNPTYNSNLICK